MLEVKFPYSYLDFERLPFPNRLSYNAEILRQNGMHTAGHTQTAGRTAATAGYSKFFKMAATLGERGFERRVGERGER
jgi:hypothetical protein